MLLRPVGLFLVGLAFVAFASTQWLFFPVYIVVLAQNGLILVLLRI